MAREVRALSALAEARGEGLAAGAGERAQAAARSSREAVKETRDVRMISSCSAKTLWFTSRYTGEARISLVAKGLHLGPRLRREWYLHTPVRT
jgi:hypothetical protein